MRKASFFILLVSLLPVACSYFRTPLEKELQETQTLAMLLFADPSAEVPTDTADGDINPNAFEAWPLENLWASLSNMPYRLQYGKSVTVDGKIYSVGSFTTWVKSRFGRNCQVNNYYPAARYTPSTGSWQTGLFAIGKAHPAVAEVNGVIYIFGGEHSSYVQHRGWPYIISCIHDTFNSVQVFNPATATLTSKPPMPDARAGATASAVNGKIYLIGGNYPNLVQEYDPDLGTYTRKADMPTGRRDAVAAVVNSKIYVIGGNKSPYNQVEEYDPATDTWATMASMPTGRYLATAQVLNNKIYVAGGAPSSPYNQLEEYNPATNTWATKATMPTGRNGSFSGVYNDRLYVLGGNASVVEVYDPTGNAWTEFRADLLTARAYHSASLADGKVYIFGGFNGTYLSSAEALDLQTLSWSSVSPMPTPRRFHASVELNGKIFLIGGHNADGTLGSVDIYDPVTDTYSSAAPLQVSRQSHAACVKDGRIYVFGGNTNGSAATALNSVEEYDPDSNSWTFKRSMSSYRTHMTCASQDDAIYLAGGMNSAGAALKTTESYDFRFDVWSIHQAMRTDRYQHALVPLRGRLYAMGGRNAGSVLSSVEKYDAALEQWIPENSMTTVRQGAAAVATDSQLFVIGGYNGSSYLGSTNVFY